MIRIILADDHSIIRGLLCQVLETTGDIKVVAVASNGEEAVTLAVLHSPDVAVIDVAMPYMNGIEAAKQICGSCPQTRVLMISAYDIPYYIQRSLSAGALGYVTKQEAGKDLIIAIRSLHQGNHFFSKQVAEIARPYIQ